MLTLFCTLQLAPMRTVPATKQFCPNEHAGPITAPELMWQKCQIRVPMPMSTGSSTTAVAWT